MVREVSLDIKNRCLLVEGNLADARRVNAQINNYMEGGEDVSNDQDSLCPVCFCPAEGNGGEENAVFLSCNHGYCRDCFNAWVGEGEIRDFPLICLSEGCNMAMEMTDIRKYLPSSSLLNLIKLSVENYVRNNSNKFRFCVSPMCPGIHKINCGSRLSYCSTCPIVICNQCNVDHGDFSCEEYKLASQPPDRRRMQIVDEILTLRCPRCKQAFLDFDGCFALKCNVCSCGFCGWCLKDCGNDAHSHVLTCQSKVVGAESYFGTKEQFLAAQNKKRREQVIEFLEQLSTEDQLLTLNSIKTDLEDLGIDIQNKL